MDSKKMFDPVWDWSWWFCIRCLCDTKIIHIYNDNAVIGCPNCDDRDIISVDDARFYRARMKGKKT